MKSNLCRDTYMENKKPFQPTRHRRDSLIDSSVFSRPPKRQRLEEPGSSHTSNHHPLPPPGAPFKAPASEKQAAPPPTDPFTMPAAFSHRNPSIRNPLAAHATRRPQPSRRRQLSPQVDTFKPAEGPPAEYPHSAHLYSNGARRTCHPNSRARSHSPKGHRMATAIANPNDFGRTFRSQPRISHGPANGVDTQHEHEHPRTLHVSRRSNPVGSKTEPPVRRRVPGVPETKDMDMFATRDDKLHHRKPSANSHQPPDKPDIVCIDTEDPVERPAPLRREPEEKPPLSSRRNTTKDAKRQMKTGLRSEIPPSSVPLPPSSRSSRLNGPVSAPSRENSGRRESQGLQKRNLVRLDQNKVPKLKKTGRKDGIHDADGEATQEQPGRGGEAQRAVEPVDVDGPDSPEPEKPTCRPSCLEKRMKLFLAKNDLETVRSSIEMCLRERKPFIELSFRGLEDTELSKISDISLPEDCNATRVLNVSYNRLTKISKSVSEWFVPLNLCYLDLAGNHLQILQGLSHYVNLRILDLSRNKLSVIPSEISQLSNLRVLDIKHNALTSLPGGFRKLRQLRFLDVSGNRLTTLPEDFAEEGSLLSCLDLSHNPSFQEFPMCVEKLMNMVDLHMKGTLVDGMRSRRDTKLTAVELLSNWAGLDLDKLKDRKEVARSRRSRVTDADEVQEAL